MTAEVLVRTWQLGILQSKKGLSAYLKAGSDSPLAASPIAAGLADKCRASSNDASGLAESVRG